MSSVAFKGDPLKQIYGEHGPFHLDHVPPVAWDHIVLYKLPLDVSSERTPEPCQGENEWDQNHVRMPYASQSKQIEGCMVKHSVSYLYIFCVVFFRSELLTPIFIYFQNNPSEEVPRWPIIEKALSRDFHSTKELEIAINSYNPKYAREWDFKLLHELFDVSFKFVVFKFRNGH